MVSGLKQREDRASAVLRGDAGTLAALAGNLLRPDSDNLVERPWGGASIRRFKRLAEPDGGRLPVYGEAFEISAFSADREAGLYPSRLHFDDGSSLDLPALLEQHGEVLLGADFIARHGACFPLLPKTLAVKELLSVQGHPEGHTEVYIIIDAEPGATLRLGFRRDVDAGELSRLLNGGIAQQQALLGLLAADIDTAELQAILAPWFADRDAGTEVPLARMTARLRAGTSAEQAKRLLGELKALYWQTLEAMNAIPVVPGQVIYNATPARLLADGGRAASAEVHALGNPERREILALEIRRPGPTFRA